MPAIPEFQRSRLASSAVGVAPVDTSGQDIANAIGGVAGHIGQDATTIGRINLQKEREAARLLKQERDAVDNAASEITAASEGIKAEGAILDSARTSATLEDYQATATNIAEQGAAGISDQKARSLYSQHTARAMREGGVEFHKVDTQRKLEGIRSDMEGSIEVLGRQTMDAFTDVGMTAEDRLGRLALNTARGAELIATAQRSGALTPESARKASENTADALARSAIFGLMESDPEAVESFIDQVINEGILEPGEKTKFLKEANNLMAAQKRNVELRQAKKRVSLQADLLEQTLDPNKPNPSALDRSIADAAGDISPGFNEKLSEVMAVQGAKVERNDAALELSRSIASLPTTVTSKRARGGRKQVFDTEKISFEQVARLQQQIVEAVASKAITSTQGQNYLKQITPLFNQEAEEVLNEQAERVFGSFLKSPWTTDTIDAWLKDPVTGEVDPTVREAAIVGMQDMFLSRLNEYEASKGRRASSAETTEILSITTEDFQDSMRVEAGEDAKLGTVMNHPRYGLAVAVGYGRGGKILWDNDLKASINESERKRGQSWQSRLEARFATPEKPKK